MNKKAERERERENNHQKKLFKDSSKETMLNLSTNRGSWSQEEDLELLKYA